MSNDTEAAQTAESARIREAAQCARAREGDVVAHAVADLLDYEAERFFNAQEAEPPLRHITLTPRERRVVLALVEALRTPAGKSDA